MITLDIGCGNNKTNGTIGLDRVRTDGVDILCDIEQSLPLKSGTIDKIIASHVLEHMGDVIKTLEEIHRVLKMGGSLLLRFRMSGLWVPSWIQHINTFSR